MTGFTQWYQIAHDVFMVVSNLIITIRYTLKSNVMCLFGLFMTDLTFIQINTLIKMRFPYWQNLNEMFVVSWTYNNWPNR